MSKRGQAVILQFWVAYLIYKVRIVLPRPTSRELTLKAAAFAGLALLTTTFNSLAMARLRSRLIVDLSWFFFFFFYIVHLKARLAYEAIYI